jgi:hypothetical protein
VIIAEAAIPDGYIYALKFLVNDPSRSEIKVTNFGITHLAFGKTYIFTTGNKGCIRESGI